jgi:hypothetical protein
LIGWRTKYPYVSLTVSSGTLIDKFYLLMSMTTLRSKNIDQIH